MGAKEMIRGLAKGIFLNALPAELFQPGATRDQKREMFSKYVDLVEIENHNYCNRVCSFCPNVFLDRRSHVEVGSDALFEKIISNLESINYSQTLVWARYHETFAHDSVFERMREARRRLPQAYMMATTNGDYLTVERVKLLRDIGIDRVYVDFYLPDGKEEDAEEIESMLNKFLKRTGLTIRRRDGRSITFEGDAPKFFGFFPHFTSENMSLRAGLMETEPKASTYRRTAACLAPIRHIVIDYNGKGVVCCQTRSDAPAHADAIIGDLSQPDYDIFDLYGDLWRYRAPLAAHGEKTGVCKNCDVSDEAPSYVARYGWSSKVIGVVPFMQHAVQSAIERQRKVRRYEDDEYFG